MSSELNPLSPLGPQPNIERLGERKDAETATESIKISAMEHVTENVTSQANIKTGTLFHNHFGKVQTPSEEIVQGYEKSLLKNLKSAFFHLHL